MGESPQKKKKKSFMGKIKQLGSSAISGRSSSSFASPSENMLDDLKERSISNNGMDFQSIDASGVSDDSSVLVER